MLRKITRRLGSPPQVRGKRIMIMIPPLVNRITPAGAGKTRGYTFSHPQKEDHPRRCGENYLCSQYVKPFKGSPPQVRGKPSNLGGYAHRPEDHPRRCGENSITAAALWVHEGSPPQVRGKLSAVTVSECASRITPAGAGKTVGCNRLCGIV